MKNLKVSRVRSIMFAFSEFGGKGDRWVTIAESRRQKAVSRNRESASNKRIADNK